MLKSNGLICSALYEMASEEYLYLGVPCRDENELVEIYKRYRPKGLRLSVCLDDKSVWLMTTSEDGRSD